ncbi:MAG: glycosyltransferase family 2 protein [Armatimonadetes bacterium]|nr:glycosyltransferase family 2 protein [Armatimonadota bacterium]
MRLSILIVNWNTRDLLRACLRSLLADRRASTEIIVVDNASTDESAPMVLAEFPSVLVQKSLINSGYAAGNNIAFSHAQGDFLLTLNPDTEIGPGTLDRAIQTLEAHPDCGVLSCKFRGPDNEIQKSVRGFPTLLGIFGDVSGLGNFFSKSKLGSYRLGQFDYEQSQYAPQPMGTFLLFRREALRAIGDDKKPFDEQFPIFFNEVDLLKRLDSAGWKCWYESSIEIKHHGGMSTRQVRKPMIWESHRSLIRYLNLHTRGPARIVLPLVSVLIWLGALIRARGIYAGFQP